MSGGLSMSLGVWRRRFLCRGLFGMFAAVSLSVFVMALAVIGGFGLLTSSTAGLLFSGIGLFLVCFGLLRGRLLSGGLFRMCRLCRGLFLCSFSFLFCFSGLGTLSLLCCGCCLGTLGLLCRGVFGMFAVVSLFVSVMALAVIAGFGLLTGSTAGLLCRGSLWALCFLCRCGLWAFGLLYFSLGLAGSAAFFLLGGYYAR